MDIKKKRDLGPFEFLLCADEARDNFKLIKHWLKHKRVGASLLDTSVGISVFGNDQELTLLGYDCVKMPEEVVRKIDDLKYKAISLWTMGEYEKVRLKMRELKLFLKVNYVLNKTSLN